jgi:DNA polymerase (family X)
MSNAEIAALFTELADLMELAGENYFKIRAYRNASSTINGLSRPLNELSPEKIGALPGIGEAISGKIKSALETGTFPTLEKWRQNDISGFLPLLAIDGLTVGRMRAMIKDLGLIRLDDLKTSLDDGRFQSYDKLDANLRKAIADYVCG